MQLITDKNNSIITNWFRKKTFSGCYMNYFSQNPNQKIDIVYDMLVDKSIKLSHSQVYVYEKLNLVKNILKNKDYPDNFIDKYINKRFYVIKNNNNISKKWNDSFSLVLPYMKDFYYPIENI